MSDDELMAEMKRFVIPLNDDIRNVMMKYDGPAEIGAMVLARALVHFARGIRGKKKAPTYISRLINEELLHYDEEHLR